MVEIALPQACGQTDRSAEFSMSRALDILLSCVALTLFAPIMILVAGCIYVEDGGSAIFMQRRLGRGGCLFGCLKFRSMRVDAEAVLGSLLANDPASRAEWEGSRKLRQDPRVTRVGSFIRKFSLDELPQFWNVLVGDMSLVGPRPIVQAEAIKYGRRLGYYYSVRPGLTGLWQVSGRSDASYRSRVAMDVIYCRSRRLSLDLRILAATIPAVLIGRGSY